MEKLTKQQAIKEHRKMWLWIAEQTEKQEKVVGKDEYLDLYYPNADIECNCFCCEYDKQQNAELTHDCFNCPIDWDSERYECMCNDKTDLGDDNLFALWIRTCWLENWKEAAKLARQIAELPEIEEE